MTVRSSLATRLEKAAADSGFDLPGRPEGEWLPFTSTHARLEIWLSGDAEAHPVAAFSRADVVHALPTYGAVAEPALPPGAEAARRVPDIPSLHGLLRRAFQLARTLPDEILHVFEERTAGMPRATEAERLVVQRVGQDIFRERLLDYWDGRCAVTGLAVRELLRASHIKPWASCETDAERLDVFNGLLLAPHLDAAFDAGFITVADDGAVLVSPLLSAQERGSLALHTPLRIVHLAPEHRGYLAWHREREFRQGNQS